MTPRSPRRARTTDDRLDELARGVEVYRGDLQDPDTLVLDVQASDATIHLACHMDFSDLLKINQIDRDV